MARNRDCAPEPHDLEQALHWPKEPHSQSAATRFKFRWLEHFEQLLFSLLLGRDVVVLLGLLVVVVVL